jgi:hypothetical protein
MNKKTKKYMVWGAGVGLALVAVVGTVVLIRRRSKNKVDLSVFDSPDIPGSGKCMNKDFIKKLQKIEEITKLPIFDWINSGARSPRHNKRVGGVRSSAHQIPTCKAADIKTRTTAIRNKIVRAAKEVGFKRIGVGKTFVHLDNDSSKPQYVAWGYPKGSRPPINPFA